MLRRFLLVSSLALTSFAFAQDDPVGTDPTDAVALSGEAAPTEPQTWLGRWSSGWEGSLSAGVNGSSGNAENFNIRTGVDGSRKTDANSTRFDLSYTYGVSEGDTTNNYFSSNLRNDWLIENTPWRPFVRTSLESDQFQDWRWRASGYGGIGYAFVDTDDKTFVGRVGVGTRYDFTGETLGFTPEGNLGLDYVHKINERQKIVATVDLFPSFDKTTDYRIEGRVEWTLLVDPESNLSLKVGIEDRYESTPGDGFRRNDLDYYALLSWSY